MMTKSNFDLLLVKLGAHSIKELPNECCGIITKDFDYIPCNNISSNPTSNFILDPLDLINNEDNIWGFFHSHPYSTDPIPSQSDLASTVFKQFKFVVGFDSRFYIYWSDNGLKFEKFNESHCST